MTTFLALRAIEKSFGRARILDGVSLEVEEGEVLVLLGPSGSGKTTLLRVIAGFESPDAGAVEVSGEDVTAWRPAERAFGMVFQHYALFPHLSVGENVAFGLESRGVDADAVEDRVHEALKLVDLAGFEKRRVHEISGGQQQRVALARALAPEPRLLLLDEPLSNLDPALRERTRRELRRAIDTVGLSAVWVTHEQEEAFDVGDRIALLDRGQLEQVGSPEELYLEPASPFVASFVGRASFLPGTAAENAQVVIGDERYVGGGVRWPALPAGPLAPGDPVLVMVRPEALRIVRPEQAGSLPARVRDRRYAGEATYYTVEIEDIGACVVAGPIFAVEPGSRVSIGVHPEGPPLRLFPVAEEGEA